MPWWSKLAAVFAAVLNTVDFASDILVLIDLAQSGDQWSTFATSLAIIVVFLLYSSYSLWKQHRRVSAFLQLFSCGILYDTYEVVCKGEITNLKVPLDNGGQLEYGTAAVKKLKTLEALFEGAPQLLIQSFVALHASETNTTLMVSIMLSALSVSMVFVSSDLGAIAGNAMTKFEQGVYHPTSGMERVVSIPTGIDFTTPETGSMFRKAWETVKSVRPAPDPFLAIVMYRSTAVLGRLGVAALFAAAFGPWCGVALAVAVMYSFVWWTLSFTMAYDLALLVLWVVLFLLLGGLGHGAFALFMVLQNDELQHLRIGFVGWIPPILITTLAFPGVGGLTMPRWMGDLSSHTRSAMIEHTCPDWTYEVMQSVENAVLLLLVVFVEGGDYGVDGRHWNKVVLAGSLCVIGALSFPLYLWRVNNVVHTKYFKEAKTVEHHMKDFMKQLCDTQANVTHSHRLTHAVTDGTDAGTSSRVKQIQVVPQLDKSSV